MKKYILLLFLFAYTFGYSCVCSYLPSVFNTYSKSDLVADVTIVNVHPAENKSLNKKFYMVDVKYNTIYKGKKVDSFYVSGSKLIGKKYYGQMTSCSLGFEIGDRLIIFHTYGKVQTLHYCTPRINEKYQKKFLESKKILQSLSYSPTKTNYKNFVVDTQFNSETGKDALDQFDGIKPINSFALLEITLDKDGTFKNVEYIKKLDSHYDQEILDYFKSSKLLHQDKFKFFEDEKFILPIHYYKQDKSNKSFISTVFL